MLPSPSVGAEAASSEGAFLNQASVLSSKVASSGMARRRDPSYHPSSAGVDVVVVVVVVVGMSVVLVDGTAAGCGCACGCACAAIVEGRNRDDEMHYDLRNFAVLEILTLRISD